MEPPSTDSRAGHSEADCEPSSFEERLPFFPPSGWENDSEESDNGPEIIVEDRGWRASVPSVERLVRRACAASVAWAARHSDDEGQLWPETIVLSSDRVVKRLNARHRGRNKPTNVLTFDPLPGCPGGEIILALGVVQREAHAARKSVADHLAHLIAHGVLHLGGHDHHQAGEARRMEMEESRVLAMMGIPNPWKPRS